MAMGNNKAEAGNSFACSPRYNLYKGNAGWLSSLYKTLSLDLVITLSGPKVSHPPAYP